MSTDITYDPFTARTPDRVPPQTNEVPAEDAVVALNLAKIRRADEELQIAKNEHQSTVKHAEGKGIHLKAAKRALKILKTDKSDDYIAELQATLEYLYILGQPVGKKQLELFRVEQPRMPSVDRAREQGRFTGIMGEGTEKCPYALESEAGNAWMEAWHGGAKERDLVLAMQPPADAPELIKGADTDADQTDLEEFTERRVEDPFADAAE